MNDDVVRVELELTPHTTPVQGRLHSRDGWSEFVGWLEFGELIARVLHVAATPDVHHARPPRTSSTKESR